MIPRAHVTAWREHAPWQTDAQVEQDLVLSRALVELFAIDALGNAVAFRGGTALHKLFFPDSGRYSEDIDLVQADAGPIGPISQQIRAVLDPWLGKPIGKFAMNATTLTYRFETTGLPVQTMRLKVEINTREHFAVLGHRSQPFQVTNPWFSGMASIQTYALEELLGTKLRALYQRQKGRDLYDAWLALTTHTVADEQVVECFQAYLKAGKQAVSRAEYEKNLAQKLTSRAFLSDLAPLLRPADGVEYDVRAAANLLHNRLVTRMPGAAWKGPRPGTPSPWL